MMVATKKKKKNFIVRTFNAFTKHLVSIGTTNRMAIYIIGLLAAGLAGGYSLARMSIIYGYVGPLACYTVVFTPIGTACSIVLSRIVDKSRDENTGPNGEGIKFALATAQMAMEDNTNPPI